MKDSFKVGDGTRIAFLDEGDRDAPVVVLSHSLGGTLAQWDRAAPGLVEAGFRVVRYDSRGHGASDAPTGEYSVRALGEDALALFDHLTIKRAAFGGLSMGGMTAMWLGVNAPDKLWALILSNTTAYIPNKAMWDENIANSLEHGMSMIARPTLERWFGATFKASSPDVVDSQIAVMEAMKPAGYAGSCAVLRDIDLRDQLKTISTPALVIAGAEDMPHSIEGAKAMADVLPNGQVTVLPHAAHLSPIENPPAFNGAITDFLNHHR